jgi:hypothetical protein
MSECAVRTAFRHAIPGGFFSRPEVSDVDVSCTQPAEFRVAVRGLDHGNHRESAAVLEVEMCGHHLHALRELDDRLHVMGWSKALHGTPVPLGALAPSAP